MAVMTAMRTWPFHQTAVVLSLAGAVTSGLSFFVWIGNAVQPFRHSNSKSRARHPFPPRVSLKSLTLPDGRATEQARALNSVARVSQGLGLNPITCRTLTGPCIFCGQYDL